jgi:branched-chain amino acid transport system substrate-binding protein
LLVIGLISTAALCARTAEAEILMTVAGDMTGADAWLGNQYQRATGLVGDRGSQRRGGVLGQFLELIVRDDFCDGDQALALAPNWRAMASSASPGIGARTPRSRPRRVYRAAEILQISPSSASGKLTDAGSPYVLAGV